MSEVAAFFQAKADELAEQVRKDILRWGEEAPHVQSAKTAQAHYEAVARAIAK